MLHLIYGLPVIKDVPPKPDENAHLVEGDMLFPTSSGTTGRGLALRDTTQRWPSGIVPYVIIPGYGSVQEAFIIATMQKMERLIAINNVACIQFRPKVADDVYYISIVNGYGCSSYVGRNTGITLNRTVTLQYPGCIDEGRIMHELLHVLGFHHEQSRPDRDSYVRVNYSNIISGLEYNFEKYSNTVVNTLNTSYDYASVMHYPSDAFSVNGFATIVPLQPGVTVGQRSNMSRIDIEEVRLFYNCSATGTILSPATTPTTVNLYVFNTTVSSTLTRSSQTYARYSQSNSNYFYETFLINVPASGTYTFMSISTMDTYGYLYTTRFNPATPDVNLVTYDDDSASQHQFRFTRYLQANTPYVLVATTYSEYVTGTYTIVASGLMRVNLIRLNTASSISFTAVASGSPRFSLGMIYLLAGAVFRYLLS